MTGNKAILAAAADGGYSFHWDPSAAAEVATAVRVRTAVLRAYDPAVHEMYDGPGSYSCERRVIALIDKWPPTVETVRIVADGRKNLCCVFADGLVAVWPENKPLRRSKRFPRGAVASVYGPPAPTRSPFSRIRVVVGERVGHALMRLDPSPSQPPSTSGEFVVTYSLVCLTQAFTPDNFKPDE